MSEIMWLIFGGAISGLTFLVVYVRRRRRQRKRLMDLVIYLEAASCGMETTLARVEDEFSLLEDELYKTISELRIAREQAQKERRQQTDNLADIAHQLKTPLTSMSLMTQLLTDGALPQQKVYIQRLDNQLTRLEWLTGSLLTMSRLDAGVVDFAHTELSFEELAARATEPMEQTLHDRKQAVTIRGCETKVICDPYWTAEALVNIIKNCSEHTPEGGGIILEATDTPLYVQITVKDTGSGFATEELPHIFRRFFRGKNTHKDSIGIGLALCRAIVEGQGGSVRAENRPEGGARFIIRFYP